MSQVIYATILVLFVAVLSSRQRRQALQGLIKKFLERTRYRHVLASILSYRFFFAGFVRNQVKQCNDDESVQKRQAIVKRFAKYVKDSGIYDTLSEGFLNRRVLWNLMILYHVQRHIVFLSSKDSNSKYKKNQTSTNSTANDPTEFQEAARIFNFATVVYGPDVVAAVERESFGQSDTHEHHSDGKRICSVAQSRRHSEILCHLTGVCKREAILVRNMEYGGTLEYTNHTVVLDHMHKQIIFAIRGTLSYSDALVDMEANTVDFCGGQAHAGMVRMARATWTMATKGMCGTFQEVSPEYELVFSGHSLGAGVATLMAIMVMHEKLVEREVKCFAYAPPATFYPSSVLEKKGILKNLSAFVYGNDFVPFFSVHSTRIMNGSLAAIDSETTKLGFASNIKLALGWQEPTKSMCDAVMRQSTHVIPIGGAAPLTVMADKIVWFRRAADSTLAVCHYDPDALLNRPMPLSLTMITDHSPGRYDFAFSKLTGEKSQHRFPMLPKTLSRRIDVFMGPPSRRRGLIRHNAQRNLCPLATECGNMHERSKKQ